MSSDARERWFCELIDAGLHEEIFDARHVTSHATPEVLAENLPPELMAKVLQAALAAGAMTADRMLETLTPQVLAHHVPHVVLWSCVTSAAKTAGLDGNGKAKSDERAREFVRRALDRGLDTAVLTAEQLLEHVTPEILAEHLPTPLKAKLLTEALRAGVMNPKLVVEVVTVKELAAHVPIGTLWACAAQAGEKAVAGQVVGAVAAVAGDKKGPKAAAPRPKTEGKLERDAAVKKPMTARAAGSAKGRMLTPAPFEDDTNVNEFAGAEDFEVVEEEDLGAMTDQVLDAVGGHKAGGGGWDRENTR
jgi:hypothetical protein